jgi:uncharacterized protein
MSAVPIPTQYQSGEYHQFQAAGHNFVYLVPTGGIFELSNEAAAVLRLLAGKSRSRADLARELSETGISIESVDEVLNDLIDSRMLVTSEGNVSGHQPVPEHFPLQSMVMNLTNQCNLSCKYCYEFGEDKLATPEGKPKFMDWDTAKGSVDYFFKDSGDRSTVHITFFGGETLMNFPLLKRVVEYARTRAAEDGRSIDFSLTTNATLLSPAIIDFLAANEIGVTVSIDGPPEMNALRVFTNGRPSYDIIAPKIKQLLAAHQTRPIAARVTLTAEVRDCIRIFRHLTQDLGFSEVGFAPVTSSPNRLHAISNSSMDGILLQFCQLAEEYKEAALSNRHHAFSNVSDTISELHAGVNKSHPCGAGLGLIGVGPSGYISPCHRFVDSDAHKLGHVSTGIDRAVQKDFLARGHIDAKYDCHSCWARPLCAGGCHHEAYVRYGDTGHPNLHYCDWIRKWTEKCLEVYGAIAVGNPGYLGIFDRRKAS